MTNTVKKVRNTIRTLVVFCGTLLNKYFAIGIQSKTQHLSDIYNYIAINNHLATSGQPTEEQFALIKAEGFQQVINLAPHDAENALKNERAVTAKLGLDYTHIPVDFMHPSEADFDRFVKAMQDNKNRKVWVHCAANMRVSAFVYRYCRDVLQDHEAEAKQAMDEIWYPFGEWQVFLKTK